MLKKWTLDEKTLLKLSSDGLSRRQSARLIGCTESLLKEVQKDLGITFMRNRLSATNYFHLKHFAEMGYTTDDIGKILDVPSSTVYYRLEEQPRTRKDTYKELPSNKLSQECREIIRGSWINSY